MRIALTLVAGCVAVAACTGSHDVSATPTHTVSYKVTGNNVTQANVKAQSYCARYGRSALFQVLQPSPSGKLAVYSCEGAATAAREPAPLAGSSVPPGSPTRLTH